MLEPSEAIFLGKAADQICLGVLGKREDISRTQLTERILHPILERLGRMPDSLLLPNDGITSALLNSWAERVEVKAETIVADWRKLGRRAVIMRDARITKAATHLILFEGPRSDYINKQGLREFKKGKIIFSIPAGNDWEVEEWEREVTGKEVCAIE
jgi:hypothetical protein